LRSWSIARRLASEQQAPERITAALEFRKTLYQRKPGFGSEIVRLLGRQPGEEAQQRRLQCPIERAEGFSISALCVGHERIEHGVAHGFHPATDKSG
jgi:hypothetical protein